MNRLEYLDRSKGYNFLNLNLLLKVQVYRCTQSMMFRKEYNCVMKYLVEEHGDFGPFYIGLKADAGDSKKNLFEWDKPMGKSNLEVDISISSTESN